MWRREANDSPLQSRIWVFFNVKNVVVVVGKLSGGDIRKERGREEQVIGQVKQSPACTLTDEKWISFFLTAVGTRKPTRMHADCPQGGRWKSPTGKKRKRTPTYTDSQTKKKKSAGISCNCISAQNDARGLAKLPGALTSNDTRLPWQHSWDYNKFGAMRAMTKLTSELPIVDDVFGMPFKLLMMQVIS